MSRASARRAEADPVAVSLGRLRLRAGVATHPGLVRDRNEDRLYADPERGVFLVVDGMGGEVAGDQAAQIALDMVRQRLGRPTGSAEERIREAIAVANDEILAHASRRPEWAGMGCVLTVVVVEDGRATVGHVGDSRLYRLREGRIEKITRDHSPVGEREDAGDLDEEAAMRHPRRNEVYRSVGTRAHAPFDPDFVEVARLDLGPEDALLLCSDGLTDLVRSAEILEVARANAGDPQAVAQGLMEAALARGGKDNVSVVFAAGPSFASAWPGAGALAASGGPGGWWRPFALGAVSGALVMGAAWMLAPDAPPEAVPPDPAGAAAGRVLLVGPGQRFAAIGDAVAAARAGDTVLVRPGTYRERLRLPDGVTLLSAVPRAAELVPVAENGPVVGIVAEAIGSGRISGFKIHGARRSALDVGIRLRDARVAIEDVEVRDARLAGVVVEGARAVSLQASWIHDNPGAGVVVRAGAAARLAHNRIEDNGRGTGETAAGVEIEPGARADLAQNVILGNAAAGVRGVLPRDRRAVLARNLFEAGGKSSRPALAPRTAGAP